MLVIPGKIPITIHPLFWLLAFFIGFMTAPHLGFAFLAVVVIFFSVLFHEFGHALTALLFQQKARIELAAFGGFTYREGRKLRLWEEFLVVINGPLAGLLLALGASLIYTFIPPTNSALLFLLKFTARVNFFWTVMNLLPLLPLDGGHVLSIILEAIFGFRGVQAALIIGLIVGVAVTTFSFIIGEFLLGAIFLILTFESFRSFRYYKMLTAKDRDETLQNLVKQAEENLEKNRVDAALVQFEEIRKKTGRGLLYNVACQEMARIYRFQERYKEAYEILYPLRKNLQAETLVLFHFLALKNRDYPTIAKLSSEVFQEKPSAEIAYSNAIAFASLKKTEPALGWLECAVREGLTQLELHLQKPEFDPIRNDPQFKAFKIQHETT